MKKIVLAKNAGFCFGVKRAAEKAIELSDKGVPVVTFGDLIHNKNYVDYLKEKGIISISSIDEVKDSGKTVLIRSHGVPPEIFRELEDKHIAYKDLTCPFVSRIHKKVAAEKDNFDLIIIVGKKAHPEVIATKGWTSDKGIVVGSIEEAQMLPELGKVLVVAQTTISEKMFNDVCDIINEKSKECMIFKSICATTSQRQHEVEQMAKSCDAMIVIGDKNSSNSRELYELSKLYCEKSYFVENANDVCIENLEGCDIIGLCAGASAPDWIIREVFRLMEFEGKVVASNEAEETSFADILEKSLEVKIRKGKFVKGTVVHVSDNEVVVNIGYKADGLIKKEDLSANGDIAPSDLFNEGDEIEAEVISLNDGEGNVILSRKKIESKIKWDEFVDSLDKDAIYEVMVQKAIKGGVLAKFNGYNAFIPASKLGVKYVEDLNSYVGQNVQVKIIDVNKAQKRFILSNKDALQQIKEEEDKIIFSQFEKGSIVIGTVKRLTNFGAFVDIGGVDGLLHITDISWGKVAAPKDVLSEKQEIEVKILNVDPEKKRISLGYKQLQPKPWELAGEKYVVGETVTGKVVRIAEFGAFVELEPTIDGLVHISQVTNHRVEKVEDALQVGQEVTAKILDVNPDKKRISLSIRALMAPEKKVVEEDEEKAPKKEEKIVIPPREEAKTSLADLFKKAEAAAKED